VNAPLDVDVRLAVSADVDALVALLGDCVREMNARGLDQWDDVYPTRATLAADVVAGTLYRAIRRDGGGADSGALLGSFTLNQTQDPEYAEIAWQFTKPPIAVVHRLMVHPDAQRAGLARLMMRFAEQRARTLGFHAIRLDAFKKNDRALALYRSLGYAERGDVRFRKGAFACFETALR
jgi:GNAT superfamily N-acetyltransferase